MNYDQWKTDSNDPPFPECCEHNNSLRNCPDCEEDEQETRKVWREARGEFPDGSIRLSDKSFGIAGEA